MKRCSTLLITREIQIKAMMRDHLISVRMAVDYKKNQEISVGKNAEKRKALTIVWSFLKKMKNRTTIRPRIFTSGQISKGNEI